MRLEPASVIVVAELGFPMFILTVPLVPPVVGDDGAEVVGAAVVAELLLLFELPQAARAMAAAAARTIRRFNGCLSLCVGKCSCNR
jgi:hypothetical protein